jgi:hypothetical protein
MTSESMFCDGFMTAMWLALTREVIDGRRPLDIVYAVITLLLAFTWLLRVATWAVSLPQRWCVCGSHPLYPGKSVHRRHLTRFGAERQVAKVRTRAEHLTRNGWTFTVHRHV